MQRLRHATFLARLVLAWFALSLGVAIAAPVVKPQGLDLVCAGGGAMKLLAKDGQGKPAGAHTLDCPLCALADVPPPVAAAALVAAVAPLQDASVPIADDVPTRTAAPPPARGPPGQQAPV
jgi:hypothetical protein